MSHTGKEKSLHQNQRCELPSDSFSIHVPGMISCVLKMTNCVNLQRSIITKMLREVPTVRVVETRSFHRPGKIFM